MRRKMLEEMGDLAVKAVRDEIRRSSFKHSPQDLIDSISYRITEEGIEISSDHPAMEYLNRGVRPHRMDYLPRGTPIPIIQDDGTVVFRTPGSKTGPGGEWYHPGLKGKHFLDRGRERATREMQRATQRALMDMARGKKK